MPERKDSSSNLKTDQILSSISANLIYAVGDAGTTRCCQVYPQTHLWSIVDSLLSPILPNYLRTISRLSFLTIYGAKLDWSTVDSSLISALLYLMHLPTIDHIELSFIQISHSSLTPPVDDSIYSICAVPTHVKKISLKLSSSRRLDDAHDSWIPYLRIHRANHEAVAC